MTLYKQIPVGEWFVEERLPDDRFQLVAEGLEAMQAIEVLKSAVSGNRLEVWSKSHAAGPKGFAPVAYRDIDGKVYVSNTLTMLMGVRDANL
jgi:hypothetical protein